MLKTQEHYDLMEQFERESSGRFDREDKKFWAMGHMYKHGETNELFIAYRRGYALGRAVERQRFDNAPLALMDKRTALGVCALTEDDFPALYALQGQRVRLVIDEPANAQAKAP